MDDEPKTREQLAQEVVDRAAAGRGLWDRVELALQGAAGKSTAEQVEAIIAAGEAVPA